MLNLLKRKPKRRIKKSRRQIKMNLHQVLANLQTPMKTENNKRQAKRLKKKLPNELK
jgi:hypothetical protein